MPALSFVAAAAKWRWTQRKLILKGREIQFVSNDTNGVALLRDLLRCFDGENLIAHFLIPRRSALIT